MTNEAIHDSLPPLQGTIVGEFLSESALSRLASGRRLVTLPAGGFLFREGEVNRNVYVMLEGQLDLVMQVPGRGCQRILTLGPGELVAWSALLGEGVMSCSALGLRECRLMAIDARTVQHEMDSDPAFGYQFMRMMSHALSRRLTATRLQLLDLFAPAVRDRVPSPHSLEI